MCIAGYPSVPAMGSIVHTVVVTDSKRSDTMPLLADTVTVTRAAPVVIVNLSGTRTTSTSQNFASPAPSKDWEAAFATLSSQYGSGGRAPIPIPSRAPSSSTQKARKSWFTRSL